MVINQGDVYWIELGEPSGSGPALWNTSYSNSDSAEEAYSTGPGYRHPHVVIQNNVFNRSRLNTVVVCVLTTNLKRAKAPGNVLLEQGEANLPKQSVVNVSQIFTVDKANLVEKIGTLSRKRVRQILEGVSLLLEPRDVEE